MKISQYRFDCFCTEIAETNFAKNHNALEDKFLVDEEIRFDMDFLEITQTVLGECRYYAKHGTFNDYEAFTWVIKMAESSVLNELAEFETEIQRDRDLVDMRRDMQIDWNREMRSQAKWINASL
jgi:hypothetical protein